MGRWIRKNCRAGNQNQYLGNIKALDQKFKRKKKKEKEKWKNSNPPSPTSYPLPQADRARLDEPQEGIMILGELTEAESF